MCETNFPWLRGAAAAHHTGIRNRVMRGPEGALSGKQMGLSWYLAKAMDFVAFEGFVRGERGEYVG